MARRDAIEAILKRLQRENTALGYQIRLGEDNLTVMLKNHKEYDYVPYRKVTIEMINPNNEVPEWDLTTKVVPEKEKNENGKRYAPESPEGRPVAKRIISDWQISEFIWSYLEGTRTSAQYDNLQWELEDDVRENDNEDGEDVEPEETQDDESNQ